MPLYESVLIARQDISQPQVEALTDAMAAVIAEHGGNVTKKEYWGLRGLAYRIKKNRKGHYMLLNIDAPSPAVHEMERQLRFNEDVLRFMTVRVEELEEGPSMMQRSGRDGRDDRGGRRGEGFGDGRGRRDRGERGPRDSEDGTSEAPKRNRDAERGEES